MRTRPLHPKILFLSFFLLFLPFLSVNSEANRQNDDGPRFGKCVSCDAVTLLTDDQEWFYCSACGILNFGTIFVPPPGMVYCDICKQCYPVDTHEH